MTRRHPQEVGLGQHAIESFSDRRELMQRIVDAVRRESPPSVLAIFYLDGSADHRRKRGEGANDELLAELGKRFAEVMSGTRCYRARREEFCVVLDGSLDELQALLDEAEEALSANFASTLVRAATGVVVLPEEVSYSEDALVLADERIALQLGHRIERERRQGTRNHAATNPEDPIAAP